MPETLLHALGRLTDDATLSRGIGYAHAKLVQSWTIKDRNRHMLAEVLGTERYAQTIYLTWSADGSLSHFVGHCTCPVGLNCKHVVAAILAADEAGDWAQVTADAKPKPTHSPKRTPRTTGLASEFEQWLGAQPDNQLAAAAAPDQYPPDVTQRIRYVLSQARDGLTVDVMKVTVRKDGSLGPRRQSYEFGHISRQGAPRFVLPIDLQIFRLLPLMRGDVWRVALRISDDEQGQSLMKLLLSSQRTHWAHVDGLRLHLADPRQGTFKWQDTGEEQQLLVQTDEGQWLKPLPLVPAWYIDSETGACGLLQTDHDQAHTKWLACAPALPAPQAEEVFEALSANELALPKPKAIKRRRVQGIEPKPVLTLTTIKARPEQDRWPALFDHPFSPKQIAPTLRLSFDYGDQTVGYWSTEDTITQTLAGEIRMIERNPRLERDYFRQLDDLAADFEFFNVNIFTGLVELKGFEQNDLALWPFDPDRPLSEEGGGYAALGVVENLVPTLQAEGWRVVIDPSWPCQLYDGPSHLRGEIEQGEDSWFSLSLRYEVDGQTFDLLPVLARLVKTLAPEVLQDDDALAAQLAGRKFVARLEDGRYVRLPLEPLLPSLRIIGDLNERVHAGQAAMISELADALEGSGVVFSGGQALLELGARLRELAKPAKALPPPKSFRGDLRPYQAIGMAWMMALADTGFGGMLADDMGLGKTVQTLAYLAARREQAQGALNQPHLPSLLVVPTSLVGNWQREAAHFVPDLSVLALHGPERAANFKRISQYDLVITTYPLLHRDGYALFEQQYASLILDEAQHVKNPTSQVARLVRKIQAKHRLALSGTPMENNLQELWCLFDWLIPGLLGNRKTFGERFRRPIEKEQDLGRQATLSKTIAPFMLRRGKDEVVTDLPPKTEIIESIELVGQQRSLYETLRATMHERVRQALADKGLASSRITVLDALLKLRQACCDPQLVKLASVKSMTTSAKRSRLIEILESLLAEGRRVLVFSQFVEMLNLIEADINARGWQYLMLTGQTKNRAKLVEAFQSGQAPLFLISLKAGGVGLNLTTADTVILYDPWWNPAIERQAMDRVHRIGQDKPVFVYRLIAQGTVETRIQSMQARKQALIDAVFDPAAQGPIGLSEEEILSLFAPHGAADQITKP